MTWVGAFRELWAYGVCKQNRGTFDITSVSHAIGMYSGIQVMRMWLYALLIRK